MKKIFILSALILVIAVLFVSCGKKPGSGSETSAPASESFATLPALPTEEQTAAETQAQTLPPQAAQQTETQAQTGSQAQPQQTEAAKPQQTTAKQPEPKQPEATQQNAPETTEKYKKTGTMHFSDSADNKYLASIASKYNVDASLLAAIYTVPDANGNIVLRFNGEKDSSGKLIRNASTLVCIYSIDKEFNSKCASEDESLNEYSYGEMKVMYLSATRYILPEFEKELSYK